MTTLDNPTRGDMFSDLGIDNTQIVTLVGTITGGSFTLTYLGQTTGAIAFNANAGTVQTALALLSSIGAGNVSVEGDNPEFTIKLYGGLAQTAMTAASSLTGTGSISISIDQLIVFTDNQLQRFFDRATTDSVTGDIYSLALAYGYRALLSAANKLHDISLGQTSEKFSQAVANLQKQYDYWAKSAGIGYGSLSMGLMHMDIDEPYSATMEAAINAYLAAWRSA